MDKEKTAQVSPEDNGLKSLSDKLDTVLQAAEEASAKAADADARAKEAEKRAQEAEAKSAKLSDELTAAKNAHAVNFTPKAQVKTFEEKRKGFRDFLTDVKAARFGNVKAALQAGAVTGSYLVPTGFLPEVLDLLGTNDDLIAQARRLPWGIEGDSRTIPNLVARSTWAFVGEGASKKVSNPTFGEIAQKLAKLSCIVVVTDELMDDTTIDLPALFADQARAGLIDTLNNWLFNGDGQDRDGILTASGVQNPTVTGIDDLLLLKQAVPVFVQRAGKFFLDNALYNQLASMVRSKAPAWLYYEEGKMRVDGSEVVALDSDLIGARRAVFGDLNNVIFSPKNEFAIRYSDVATVVEGESPSQTTHHLFQENKQAFRFEMRADISIVGSVWAKATVPAPSQGA